MEFIQRVRTYALSKQKYAPVLFFVGGFVWDSLTLQRIDNILDRVILCTYLAALSLCLYLFNRADDGRWKSTLLGRYEEYLPLAIQFFLGGLVSAYVIYFSRSVSMTKSVLFFVILVLLLFANELLRDRISNKYMQFSAYFLVNFTFFAFFLPVVLSVMNDLIFLLSGVVSIATTLGLVFYTYRRSASTRAEIHIGKMLALIAGIYLVVNAFYCFNLIPPVPLALETGLVAHEVKVKNGEYHVSYEQEAWYVFWRDNSYTFDYQPGDRVYVFSSIFAPTELEKAVFHRWRWFDEALDEWKVVDEIGYKITGGRDDGYRGYTYKENLSEGRWKVDVITKEEHILGIVKFEINPSSRESPAHLNEVVF